MNFFLHILESLGHLRKWLMEQAQVGEYVDGIAMKGAAGAHRLAIKVVYHDLPCLPQTIVDPDQNLECTEITLGYVFVHTEY